MIWHTDCRSAGVIKEVNNLFTPLINTVFDYTCRYIGILFNLVPTYIITIKCIFSTPESLQQDVYCKQDIENIQ